MILADDAASFISAFSSVANVIDTTLSLSNTGTTIMLMNDTGGVSDSISYTKDLGAAGDGNSLQRNDAVWIPALPTPGGPNATTPATPEPDVATSSSETSTSASTKLAAVSSYVPPPEPLLYAYAGKDRDAIAGADLEFEGEAYDKNGNWLSASTTRFTWNFGDGASGEGPLIRHHFGIPGRYAVVLMIANAQNADSAQVIVTVHPVLIDVSSDADSIVLSNRSNFDLDLSHWRLFSSGKDFELPAHTKLLAGATAAFSQEVTKLVPGSDTALEYPNGVVAIRLGTTTTSASLSVSATRAFTPPVSAGFVTSLPAPSSTEEAVDPEASVSALSETDSTTTDDIPDTVVSPVIDPVARSAQAASAAAASGSSVYWWLGAIGLALMAGGVAFYIKRSRRVGWDIVESDTNV